MTKEFPDIEAQDDLLERYIQCFFGYGNLKSQIWFIGMEEGGDTDEVSLQKELSDWKKLGCPIVRDIAPAGIIGTNRWFSSESPPIQRTWGKLIRATLRALKEPTNNEHIRKFQRNRLGRTGGGNCLLELLPLRSPNVGSWRYHTLSALPYLQSRKTYEAHVIDLRKNVLRELLDQYFPRVVVFYGMKYNHHWREIVGSNVVWSKGEYGKVAVQGRTRFYIINHPGRTPNRIIELLGDDFAAAVRRG